VRVAPDEESLAVTARGAMAVPETFAWLPGLVTETVLEIVHENDAVPVKPALSVALTVTEQVQAVVGVPVMAPDDELMDSPAGRPVADHEAMVAVEEESVAELCNVEMAVPERLD
jgi:hypothetical protein